MNKRNVIIEVTDVAFYANFGTEIWYRCHVFVTDAAPGTTPQSEIGGWDRTLKGRLHPTIEFNHKFPLPGRFILDVERTVKVRVAKAWEHFLKSFNQGCT